MNGAPTGPSDSDALRSLLDHDDANGSLSPEERSAFASMLNNFGRVGEVKLSRKQRAWVDRVRRLLELDADDVENLASRGLVPTGKPVELAPVLRMPLPLKPPGRR